jgi:DNA-binding NarL/FixJ family response regulator
VIRIAIADDHPMFREGLRNALSVAADLQVVGEASDGQAALELCARERPDVLMLDLTMPRCDGFGVLEQLHRVTPATRALVLTMHMERRFEEKSLSAGAAGFLRKDSPVSTILRAVRAIASGETIWASRRGAFQVLSRLAAPTPVEPLSVLTSREREILVLLGRGRRNREIAEETGLSEKTVATHVASVLGKLGLRSRVEAAVLASRRAADLGSVPADEKKR